MPTRERPVDRGTDRGRRILADLGRELRAARQDRGLSQETVGRRAVVSSSTVSRLERGLSPGATFVDLARLLAVVGLELSARAFPGGAPVRDQAQVALLARFKAALHRSIRWSAEVPLPIRGDQRAWDAVIGGGPPTTATPWRFGVEAETAPRDVQTLARRLSLKARDSAVDGVILVLPATRRTRAFLHEAEAVLVADFPVQGSRALELLRAGIPPGGSSIIVM